MRLFKLISNSVMVLNKTWQSTICENSKSRLFFSHIGLRHWHDGHCLVLWLYYCTVVVNLISRMTWFLTSQSSHHHSDFSHIIKANTYGKTEEKILKWPSISHPFPMQLHESMDALIASASTKKKVICLRICVQITILVNFFAYFHCYHHF